MVNLTVIPYHVDFTPLESLSGVDERFITIDTLVIETCAPVGGKSTIITATYPGYSRFVREFSIHDDRVASRASASTMFRDVLVATPDIVDEILIRVSAKSSPSRWAWDESVIQDAISPLLQYAPFQQPSAVF